MRHFIERLQRYRKRNRRIEKAFLQSGLFLPDWYARAYPETAPRGPAEHFLGRGWIEGRRPNPLFDPQWYLRQYPDVAQAGVNPAIHYWRYGEAEHRRPSPLFDPLWYRKQYGGELGADGPLAHYLRHRHLRRHSPNPLFDVRYYVASNPDLPAHVDPFEHFLTTGHREGRNPSAGFDVRAYARRYLANDRRDPITHYYAAGYDQTGDAPEVALSREGATPADEIRRYTAKSPYFEELDEGIALGRARLAKLFAFHLPQFHAIPENDAWWGKGFTEWRNVCRGTPRFAGHYQPRVPRDFGFYDLSDPRVLPRQAAAAKAAGIHGFCFYYYNFNGKRLLERPIEDLLARPQIDLPFCLIWANENWTRRWDGASNSVLVEQSYRPEDERSLVDDLARHFRDSRYFRVAGRPLLVVYRTDVIPEVPEVMARLRSLFASRHGEEPWILMAESFYNRDPQKHGFDGAVEFPPHGVTEGKTLNDGLRIFDPSFSAQVFAYEDVVAAATSRATPDYPLIRTVFPSWDNDARRQGQGATVIGSTPRKYAAWLSQAIAFAQAQPFHGERLAFINAWNEWAEGAYLEPDVHFGGAYLNATARAVTGALHPGRRKILFVGHDACFSGAQLLLLNLVRVFIRQLGFEARVVLCADGELLGAYREAAPTEIRPAGAACSEALARHADDGFDCAIVNSLASAALVPLLKQAGFRVLCLVHEMPELIAQKNLGPAAALAAAQADEMMFPSGAVREAFERQVAPVAGAVSVRPQGLYRSLARVAGARESLLAELGLPGDARLVVNIGYGDRRKGLDLFCEAARCASAERPDVFFVWVGDLEKPASAPNARFLGRRSDIGRILSAADVFALSSREDPFPSVLLEAMSLGVPVVAFADAGGFAELLQDADAGELVAHADAAALSRAILRRLAQPAALAAGREDRAAGFRARFAFDLYAFELAQRLHPALRSVSVIVPNYNYGRYVEERLKTIFAQSLPILEVLFLDDCSTDDSIGQAERGAAAAGRSISVISSEVNSGNAFAQWLKGVKAARGELVWIAEADDLAAPEFLERLCGFFDDPAVGFAFSDSRIIDADGAFLRPSYKDYYARLHPEALKADMVDDAKAFAATYLSQRNLILNASAVLWRRSRLMALLAAEEPQLRGYRLAGDWYLYSAACAAGGKVAYCASPLNTHRRHRAGVTQRLAPQAHLEEVRRIHEYVNATFGVDAERLQHQRAYLKELQAQFGL
jgi:glycosyltransferase involved in cell wall biosynthesis